ncbi:DNA polymerase III chi subunit [gamma proteobacterium HdN1]|nr:DNA polymerase III chi subunit [gamma proteobacterium HdN1]
MAGQTEQVDFYILSEQGGVEPLTYAMRLIDKVYHLGMSLFTLLPNEEAAAGFSERLWAYSQESFLAHDLGNAQTAARLRVDWKALAPSDTVQYDVLINLAGPVPEFHTRFRRVTEIVPGDTKAREQVRENYRAYKEKGYPIKIHEIGSTSQKR